MSGGSQHNPNGRQSQMSSGWSPLQLQMANLLARAPHAPHAHMASERAPQAHMASERGVTWHTPTPPPHLYHVPVPSPPHPLQAMKGAAGNSVFRHTATPPELFRHTPTPPDKHLLRHTPSPGDVKAGPQIPPADLYPHLGPAREKLRPEELLAAAYARGGVDLSISRTANGSPSPAAPAAPPGAPVPPPAAPALSVRDAPTINSLIARGAPRAARVDALIERLAPLATPPGAPVLPPGAPAAPAASPHSVIVPRRNHSPSPPSNEDSADSSTSAGSSKRKRKPERTVRVAAPVVAPRAAPAAPAPPDAPAAPSAPTLNGHLECSPALAPVHNDALLPVRRKSRSGSAETIADIAAMIASSKEPPPEPPQPPEPDAPDTIDKLKSVLSSPKQDPIPDTPESPELKSAAAPKRTRNSSESTNVPIESPSEGKSAETLTRNAQPTAASFVEVENQLKKMFAGLEDEQVKSADAGNKEGGEVEGEKTEPIPAKRRRKSAPTKGGATKKPASTRRSSTADDPPPRRKPPRKSNNNNKKPKDAQKDKDAYDSGSNASSSKSRGPYIQIRGPRASPVSVAVFNAGPGDDEEVVSRRKPEDFRNGLRAKGLHASTLGLRYDATTPDVTWLCVFCNRGPHADSLGDLFGPYTVSTDCEEYRRFEETAGPNALSSMGALGTMGTAGGEVWVHGRCALWAPGLLAAGTRLWGLPAAVWSSRASRCASCSGAGAGVACSARACRARAHYPCARAANWSLCEETYRPLCPNHRQQ